MIIMAFEPNNNRLKEALRQNPEAKIEQPAIHLPSSKDKTELTRSYGFTLQPSVHAKIRQIAKKQGSKSASRFLNDLFKDMEV